MNLSCRPARRTDVTVHELDGEALIYDPVTADTHRLNRTGLFIWQRCDGYHNVAEIARRLTEGYDVALVPAALHSARMIAELERTQLVTTTPTVSNRREPHNY
ncbi:MAG: PqqD family protein [Phycisphaerae bacterium]